MRGGGARVVTITRGRASQSVRAESTAARGVVGIEHEFIVRSSDGATVDFRLLLPTLDVPRARLDPGDRHAVRLASGIALTCDGSEAEFATPPVIVGPGFATEALRWVSLADGELARLLGSGPALEGVSTHLSVAVPDEHITEVAGLFARTFAPALMLLMERADSLGLLVRPRWGRLELGGDYCKGDPLGSALALATGGALLCLDVAMGRTSRRSLPPAVEAVAEPAVDRFGWYLERSAFGTDLYRQGRSALLPRRLAPPIGGQQLLERSWDAARRRLASTLTTREIDIVDQYVSGERPLPLESSPSRAPARSDLEVPSAHPAGEALRAVARPKFEARPHRVTWDYVLYEVRGRRRTFLSVPRDRLAETRAQLEAGQLDRLIEGHLASPGRQRILRDYHDAVDGGLFDGIAAGASLAPPERGRDGVPRLVVARPASPRPSVAAQPAGASSVVAAPTELSAASDGNKGEGSEIALPGSGPFWENWNLPLVIGGAMAGIGLLLVAVFMLGGGAESGGGTDQGDGPLASEPTEAPTLGTPFGTAAAGRGVRIEAVIIDGEHFYRYGMDLISNPVGGTYDCGGDYAVHIREPLSVVRSFERPQLAVADPAPSGCGFGRTVEFTTNNQVVDPETSVINPDYPEVRFTARVIGEWCRYVLEDLAESGGSNRAIENLCERNPPQD